jgi:hypothetical protein
MRRGRGLPPAEFMAAFAHFAAGVQLGAAFRALLFPRPGPRLFLFYFRLFGGSQPHDSRFIGLLHRTLRMYAATRIGRFAADRAKISDGLWNDDKWLDIAHVAPSGEGLSVRGGAGSPFIVADR